MKKIVYLLAIMGLAFTACEPLEDINAEVDALQEVVSGDAVFVFSDDDYSDLDLDFGNFNSVDDAKSMIPALLIEKYPVWGEGSSALVSFDIYAPKRDEKSLIVYEVTTEDYDANPETAQYDNFDDKDQVYALLASKYPTPEDRALVSLTYKFYNGSLKTLNNGFLYLNEAWEMIDGFTSEEYEAMGEGFPNFSSEDEAFTKISIFLKDKFKYEAKSAGDIEGAMFKLYITDTEDIDDDGETDDSAVYSYIAYFIYDGSEWTKYNNVLQETVQFGHDGSTWVPDNTIKYTLTQGDYDLVDNGFYGNFDVRSGKAEELESVRLDKINTILLNNFPAKAVGQKYIVSYNVYSGSDEVWTMNVILEGEAYVLK